MSGLPLAKLRGRPPARREPTRDVTAAIAESCCHEPVRIVSTGPVARAHVRRTLGGAEKPLLSRGRRARRGGVRVCRGMRARRRYRCRASQTERHNTDAAFGSSAARHISVRPRIVPRGLRRSPSGFGPPAADARIAPFTPSLLPRRRASGVIPSVSTFADNEGSCPARQREKARHDGSPARPGLAATASGGSRVPEKRRGRRWAPPSLGLVVRWTVRAVPCLRPHHGTHGDGGHFTAAPDTMVMFFPEMTSPFTLTTESFTSRSGARMVPSI